MSRKIESLTALICLDIAKHAKVMRQVHLATLWLNVCNFTCRTLASSEMRIVSKTFVLFVNIRDGWSFEAVTTDKPSCYVDIMSISEFASDWCVKMSYIKVRTRPCAQEYTSKLFWKIVVEITEYYVSEVSDNLWGKFSYRWEEKEMKETRRYAGMNWFGNEMAVTVVCRWDGSLDKPTNSRNTNKMQQKIWKSCGNRGWGRKREARKNYKLLPQLPREISHFERDTCIPLNVSR